MRNTRSRLAAVALTTLALLPVSPLRSEGKWPEIKGEQFTFTEVRPGVWHVQGTGTVAAGSNGALIEGDRDLLLVDSHMSPAAARALLADLPAVSEKPIRYVVNTHFHFDHTHGNQVFGPDVEIVAHEFTRQRLASDDSRRGRAWEGFILTLPERMEQAGAAMAEADGERREQLAAGIERMGRIWEESQEVVPVAPTLALRQAVTLYRGGREIRILHLGRGHTGGDVVVYLPADKVLVSGDLLTDRVPYMGDAFFEEWVDTLGALGSLEVEVVLPGHGAAYEGVERAGHLQEYLAALWEKLSELHARGVSAEEAAAVDMTAFSDRFPSIEGPGVSRHAVDRAYELLGGDG